MKSRRMAIYGLTAGLLGGGAAGFVLTGSSLAGAQVSATDPSAPSTAPAAPAPARGEWMRSALAPLVDNGTITQDQADAVIGALQEARPKRGPGLKGRPGLRGLGHRLEAAASALGMSEGDLRRALAGGKSLADVAQEKGVAVSQVVDALVAEMKTRLDEHVAAGHKTQAEADQILADARSRIEAFVNRNAPAGGPAFGKGFAKGHRRGMPAPSADSSSPSGTVS